MVKPAYHIALTPVEKRLIAELAAIQSQIEWLMHLTLLSLLKIKPETIRAVMGSTKLSANAEIWIRIVRELHPFEEAKVWAEWCFSETEVLARHRNDFLHTVYGFVAGNDEATSDMWFNWGHRGWDGERKSPRMAVRVRNNAKAPLKDLSKIVDRAAYLSCAIAHVEWTAQDAEGSPWLRRLGGQLPPQKGEWGPHKARVRPPPPQSSRE